MAQLKHIHVFSRSGQSDILLGFATRDSNTDALYKWGSSGWILLKELTGTNLIYDSVTWRERIYWVDGKNALGIYDGLGFCTAVSTAPVGQFIRVFQDRLVIGGDARTQAEVEAAGGTWPADSNRNRVLYCEVLDDATWSPSNFIDARTANGEVISGLAVGGLTTSDEGAQSVLVIFKPNVTMLHRGALGGAEVQLDIVSEEHGCPGYHTMSATNVGLLFVSNTSVCRLKPAENHEPEEIGFAIAPDIDEIPTAFKSLTAGFYYKHKYHVSFASASDSATNDAEYELDMRVPVFPQEQNWYGPHTGDRILQYAVYSNQLVAAEAGSLNMWQVDVEDNFLDMDSDIRQAVAVLPRVTTDNMTEGKLDGIGVRGEFANSTSLVVGLNYERGVATSSYTWTAPSANAQFPLIRPAKRPGRDVQVTLTHSLDSDVILHSIYFRVRTRRRQSEKQSNSSQS